jgi:hypothetical protein
MDNLATFFSQYGGLCLAAVAAILGYGRLYQQTSANTKSIDKLQDGLTEVRIQSARTETKIDLIMKIVEKKA